MGTTATEHEDIVATFTYKTFESADRSYCVFRFKNYDTHKDFTAIGSMLPKQKNVPVKLTGSWEINKKTGRKQFKVVYFEQAKPSGKTEVIAFFTALRCGIGGIKANTIWNQFGNKTWDIIENSPERLLEVPMINQKILTRFMEALKENNLLRDLMKLFAQSGVSLSGETLHALIEKYGSKVVEIITENPFEPCGTIDGYSFDRADALAYTLGYPIDHENRLVAALYKMLDDAAISGHVCLPKDELLNLLIKFTGCNRDKCVEAIRKAFHERKIIGANYYLYTPKRYEQESAICEHIIRLMTTGDKPIEGIDALIEEYEAANFKFAECQRDAIKNVFKNPFTVITGGPGVGKTTVTKGILAVHQQVYGASSEPILLAPHRQSLQTHVRSNRLSSPNHPQCGWLERGGVQL